MQESLFLLGDLEAQIEAFVDHDNYKRYRESLNNITPAGVDFTCGKEGALKQRERIKRKPSKREACFKANAQPNSTNQMRQTLS